MRWKFAELDVDLLFNASFGILVCKMAGSLRLAPTVDEMADASRLARRPLMAADVLTAGEVARLLHVPKSTVEDWARRGVIPSKKVGRRRLYLRQRIEALLLNDRA